MKSRLARKVARARFTPVRIREGYAMADVDQLLDLLQNAFQQGQPVAPLIDAAHFTRVHTREGYETHEVDDFLEKLRDRDASTPPDDGPYAGDPDVVTHIREADFAQAIFRRRYEMEAVEHLVDDLLEAAMQGTSLAAYLDSSRLPLAARLKPGYPVHEVDRFLASLREERSPA